MSEDFSGDIGTSQVDNSASSSSSDSGISSVQDRMMDSSIPEHMFDNGSGGYVDTTVGLPMYDENNQRIRSKEQLDAYLSRKGSTGQQQVQQQQVKQPANANQAVKGQQQQPNQGATQQQQTQANQGNQQFDSVASMFLTDKGEIDRNAMLKSVSSLTGEYKPEYLTDYDNRIKKIAADKAAAAELNKLEPHEELARFKSERIEKEINPLSKLYALLEAGQVQEAMGEIQSEYQQKAAAIESELLKKTIEIARNRDKTEDDIQKEQDALEAKANMNLNTVSHQIFGKNTAETHKAIGEMLFGNDKAGVKGEMSEMIQLTYDLVTEAAKNPQSILGSDFKTWFMKSIATKQPRFATIAKTGYKAYNGSNLKYYIDGARSAVAKQQSRVSNTQQRKPASTRPPAVAQKSPMASYFEV